MTGGGRLGREVRERHGRQRVHARLSGRQARDAEDRIQQRAIFRAEAGDFVMQPRKFNVGRAR